MSKKSLRVFIGNNRVDLTEKDYRAAGGEGSVYVKGDTAYKIYHDTKRMIPEAKIKELSSLKSANILRPDEVIKDSSGNHIGFTMRYVSDTVYLCKLFTKTFKNQNGVKDSDVDRLIKNMRTELDAIHGAGVIVGDYNEMNFLTDCGFTVPYHIDVDSWQTKNFKATAIMETVRDHSVKFGVFNELTDWFAFAVITFQLYTGLHPFKGGRHPDYKPKDWSKRMDDGISVFNKDVTLPSFVSSFDLIPKNQLDWYKTVFVKGERSPSPVPGDIAPLQVKTISVPGNESFDIKNILIADSDIVNCYDFGSRFFVQTKRSVSTNGNTIKILNRFVKEDVFTADSQEDTPISVFRSVEKAVFYQGKDLIGHISSDAAMPYNGAIYTIYNGSLVENTFERVGKMKHLTRTVCSIFQEACTMYPGVVVQDIIGTCWLAIPFKRGSCTNTHVKELDGKRIIDAKFCGRCCFVFSELNGKYDFHRVFFNEAFSKYEIATDEDVELCEINVTYNHNVYVYVNNSKLVLFKDLSGSKEFSNPPIDTSMPLCSNGSEILFYYDNKLNGIKTKVNK